MDPYSYRQKIKFELHWITTLIILVITCKSISHHFCKETAGKIITHGHCNKCFIHAFRRYLLQ